MPKTQEKQPTREQLLEYTQALEGVNKQLVIALKQCLKLLANVPVDISGSKDWQDMYDQLNLVADLSENLIKHESNKNLH